MLGFYITEIQNYFQEPCRSGLKVLGFTGLEFRGLGFRGLGSRGLGFKGLGA